MLVLSVLGPSTGTIRVDLHGTDCVSGTDREAMDQLWKLDQGVVDVTQADWRLLSIARCAMPKGEWLHWLGLYAPSPVSPDGRSGYYIGLGVFLDGTFQDAGAAYRFLNAAFERYLEFVSAYRHNPTSFPMTQMRLDRIRIEGGDLIRLEKNLCRDTREARSFKKSVADEILFFVAPFQDETSFVKIYREIIENDTMREIRQVLVSSDGDLFTHGESAQDERVAGTDSPHIPQYVGTTFHESFDPVNTYVATEQHVETEHATDAQMAHSAATDGTLYNLMPLQHYGAMFLNATKRIIFTIMFISGFVFLFFAIWPYLPHILERFVVNGLQSASSTKNATQENQGEHISCALVREELSRFRGFLSGAIKDKELKSSIETEIPKLCERSQ